MQRLINEEDIQKIIEIEKSTIGDTLGYQMLHDSISNPLLDSYVYEENNEIKGYISVSFDGEVLEILNLCVKEECQGKGIGNSILENTLNIYQKRNALRAILEVRSKNIRAINLYSKKGFKQIHTRKGYYNDDDALVYEKIF